MISFGFTIVKVLDAFEKSQGVTLTGPMGREYSPATVGLALIAIGTMALVAAVFQHRQSLSALRQRGLQPRWSLTLTVASLVAVLGVFAFGGTVLRY
jgi:putative membrane protein